MDQEKNNANGKSRRPIVYIKEQSFSSYYFHLYISCIQKLLLHNKKRRNFKSSGRTEETRRAKKERRKKKQEAQKQKRAGRTSKASTSCRTAC
ncbi:hypothetical protein ACT7DP_18990 [Bacillus paranthracis]